jgi:hypothetical protein
VMTKLEHGTRLTPSTRPRRCIPLPTNTLGTRLYCSQTCHSYQFIISLTFSISGQCADMHLPLTMVAHTLLPLKGRIEACAWDFAHGH